MDIEILFLAREIPTFFVFELVHLNAKVTSVSPIPVCGNIRPYEFIMHM